MIYRGGMRNYGFKGRFTSYKEMDKKWNILPSRKGKEKIQSEILPKFEVPRQ